MTSAGATPGRGTERDTGATVTVSRSGLLWRLMAAGAIMGLSVAMGLVLALALLAF